MADTTPDPHRDEPTPAPEEGMRPEAVASGVRPSQDEPDGPLPGLLATAAAEVKEAITDSPEAEEQLEAVGVEEEGIESGQIMGITLAILVSVAILAVTVFWAFYLPKLNATETAAEDAVDLLPEGRQLIADAEARLGDYGMMADSTFTLPINVAMEDVIASYSGASAAEQALDGEIAADDVPVAVTRQGFNVAPVELAPMRAVRAATSRGAESAPVPETATDAPEALVEEAVEAEGSDTSDTDE